MEDLREYPDPDPGDVNDYEVRRAEREARLQEVAEHAGPLTVETEESEAA